MPRQGWRARKTSEGRLSGGRIRAVLRGVQEKPGKKSGEKTAQTCARPPCCRARRGRFSYKRVDNGEEGEKSAEKLTIENKFHVKQFFAARVSHETKKRSEKPKYALFSGFFRCENGAKSGVGGKFRVPKNFYRKIRCLSPKFFGARCYTNFLRKIAVFHGRRHIIAPNMCGRRRYGVKSLSFVGFMA